MSSSQENLEKQDGEIGSTSNLLKRLTLQEDEAGDLISEEELDAEEIKPKWLALGHLLTTKTYSHSALIADMMAAWNPALRVTWRRIDANLFSVQFNCLGDWNKAIHQGPWDFKGYAVILAEYDGFTNPEKVRLDKLERWAQIHKLPDGVLKSEKALGNLAQRVGKVQEVQVTLPNGFVDEFIRVRVKLDVNKKLTRVVGITKGGATKKYLVKFGKLPTFCHACGLMGHWYEECGTGEHDTSKFEWGNFILALRRGRGGGRGGRSNGGRGKDDRPFGPTNGRGHGDEEDYGPGAFGRGRGHGLHEFANWRYNNTYNRQAANEPGNNMNTQQPDLAGEETTMTENAESLGLDVTRSKLMEAMDTNVLGKRYATDSGVAASCNREDIPQGATGVMVPVGNTSTKVDIFVGEKMEALIQIICPNNILYQPKWTSLSGHLRLKMPEKKNEDARFA
ncbi:hypothetical protein D1007_43923 [Hordeum vulgare]|nr:hypothetical protein D1007_43923 [Hordeum vulgare]